MELSSNQVKSNRITNLGGRRPAAPRGVYRFCTRDARRLPTGRVGLRFRETKCAHSLTHSLTYSFIHLFIHLFVRQRFNCVPSWVSQRRINKAATVSASQSSWPPRRETTSKGDARSRRVVTHARREAGEHRRRGRGSRGGGGAGRAARDASEGPRFTPRPR